MARSLEIKKKDRERLDRINAGWDMIDAHPLFSPMVGNYYSSSFHISRPSDFEDLPEGWAIVHQNGWVQLNTSCLAEPEEWCYIIAHCLLHLGFNHFHPPFDQTNMKMNKVAWNAACDVTITRFLADLKLGKPPEKYRHLPALPAQSEEVIYQRFIKNGTPKEFQGLGTNGLFQPDMVFEEEKIAKDWPGLLGCGLRQAVSAAVNVAGGALKSLDSWDKRSPGQVARLWFIDHYPLLGSLAAAFKIIEDPALCARMQISVAAIDEEMQEIYLNPAAGMDNAEMRFVMAHEMLHAGLRHHARRQGREAFYWNVACDYVINGWLVEMGLGALPQFGGLYDATLKGFSAEAVYDRIVTDMRHFRKLATLRGVGLGDILEPCTGSSELNGESLDDFYRRCLNQGLCYHQEMGRGLIPAGLVEEIEALSQPPIMWDVALARWFDDHFPPIEKSRSYARPSRRQSSTPDIPRPSYVAPQGEAARTFGVILDTSGSMDRHLLAQALGVIASYSLSRDVPYVRVVFCDAVTYDQGYLSPEDIAGRVRVRGRGGTILQPGIDLLEQAADFPQDGPVLIITDGYCDRLHIHREHAFLVPEGHHLPFIPRGPVFYFQ